MIKLKKLIKLNEDDGYANLVKTNKEIEHN